MSTSTEPWVSSTSSTLYGSKSLRLYIWGATPTLPSLDPTSLYAATILYATFSSNPQFRIQLVSATTSLLRVPLLQVLDENNLTSEVHTSIESILSFCVAFGLDSALQTDAEMNAKSLALHALLDDQLLDLTLHSLFSLPPNYRTTTAPAYSSIGPLDSNPSSSTLAKIASLPLQFQPSIPSRLRNAVETRLTAVGLWGLGGKEASAQSGQAYDLAARAGIIPTKKRGLAATQKEAVREEFEKSKLTRQASEVLEVLDSALESKVLSSGEVGSLDAKVFSYLAPLLLAHPKLPIDTLPRLISTRYPKLAEYLFQTKEKLYPEGGVQWLSQSEAIKTPPTTVAQGASGGEGGGLWSYIWPSFGGGGLESKASFTTNTLPQAQYQSNQSSGARRKPNSSTSPENSKLKWGRAVWICSAVIGLVGYTFASGIVSVRIAPQPQFATHDPSISCTAPSSLPFTSATTTSQSCPRRRTIVTGTFNSPNLYVLSYDPLSPTQPLAITQELPAMGPHQYLSFGLSSPHSSTEYLKTVYATTWANPSTLSSWHFSPSTSTLSLGNSVEITAAGSYVHVQPPPYYTLTAPGFGSKPGVGRWLASAGGPTGELHRLDSETGEIGEKVREIIFLKGGKEELEFADKSRRSLRFGAHSFDCSNNNAGAEEAGAGAGEESGKAVGQVAFVADLGANAVQAYSFPSLRHLYSIPSIQKGDGPRHAIPHPHLPLIFTVTEHTNFVDAYSTPPSSSIPSSGSETDKISLEATAVHLARADMLTRTQATKRGEYRGDTLRFSSNLDYIYASTRGKTVNTKGLLLAYRLVIESSAHNGELQVEMKPVAKWETRTSGGKANAIELAPQTLAKTEQGTEAEAANGQDLLVLTDDEQGWIDVVSFDFEKQQFRMQATTRLPKLQGGDEWQGASHAIWLN
ncbi:hypothetical protein NDA18_002160 [Ustilago nuda]|nr:hypothetical protein NDA18_002160 [Ustilago nuda]